MARTVLYLHSSSGLYGADLQLLALVSGLDGSRYRPLVVLPDGELAALLDGAGVETVRHPLAVLRRSLASGRGLPSAAAGLARDRRALARLPGPVALVHSNTSIVLAGPAAARRFHAPYVQHVREIYAGIGGEAGRLAWPLLRRRLERADALLCVSAAAAAQFRARAAVVHSGFRPIEPRPRAEARSALGLDGAGFVVAVVGRISDWKGQDVLARALAEPELAATAATGLVVGDAAPGQEEHLAALAGLRDRLGLGDRLRLLGHRSDVETVYGAADAVAVPSTHPDALPNVAIEAALAGVPVVASAIGGLPEIVADGATGLLVPPGDPGALARALRSLADDPALGRRLAEASSAETRGRFGVRRMVDEVQACYDRLLP